MLTDSEHSRQDILKHLNLPADRVQAILLACGEAYRPEPDNVLDKAVRQKYNLPAEYVLYLGGYDVRKNIEGLLRAYVYVKTSNVPLVLAGRLPEHTTPRFADVTRLLQSIDIADSVQVIGEIDEADKPSLYRMAKCFVFPSIYEGFGLPVLEAMACGTPVVAADTSSLGEIVGDAGFLVRPDDIERLGGAIVSLLVDEDLAHDLAQKSRQRAAGFTWDRTARETAAVYRQVLSAGTG